MKRGDFSQICEDASDGYRYRIGFEIEKEDGKIYRKYCKYSYACNSYTEFFKKYGWDVGSDGSLDCEIGLEARSPILPLYMKDIRSVFKGGIRDIANAKYTRACGGHITVSDTKRTSGQLIGDLYGYMPLLYALYPYRLRNAFCKVGDLGFYLKKSFDDKYTALHSRAKRYTGEADYVGAGLEIRYFDINHDTTDLLHRVRLLSFMMRHPAKKFDDCLDYINKSKQFRQIIIKYVGYLSNVPKRRRERLTVQSVFDRMVKYANEISCDSPTDEKAVNTQSKFREEIK